MLDISVDKKLGTFTLSVRLTTATGVTALFGRSGSGKTTLINMLAGLETPQQGHIRINDTVLFDADKHINLPPEKRRIGYVFQDSRLFPHLSVEQNLTYGQKRDRSRGGPRGSVHGQAHAQTRHGFGDIVDLLALSELLARRPLTLSGGEKQRVAIGRALLSDPDIILMDEPLASLDAAHRAEILPFIEQLRDELRIPVVYVSHSLEEVIHLADTIAVMADGRIAASGAVEDVLSRLDIIPVTGRHEAGAVVLTTIMKHDDGNGLSEVSCAAGTFTIPRVRNPVGESLRLRLRARDISLATEKPRNTSILNIFQGRIMEIDRAASPSQVDILVDIGVPVIARITTRSLSELGLVVGSNAYVMVKAVSIDRPNPDASLIIHQR